MLFVFTHGGPDIQSRALVRLEDKLQVAIDDIILPTTARIGYAIGLWNLTVN